MSGVNKAIILGNVGSEPEVRHMQNGTAVVNFSVATSSKYKNRDGEMVEDTQWHRVVAYNKLAEIIGEYVQKGTKIYIEGSLKYGKYTDKNGVEKNTTDIVAKEMQILSRQESHTDRRNHENEQQQHQGNDIDSDDVPF